MWSSEIIISQFGIDFMNLLCFVWNDSRFKVWIFFLLFLFFFFFLWVKIGKRTKRKKIAWKKGFFSSLSLSLLFSFSFLLPCSFLLLFLRFFGVHLKTLLKLNKSIHFQTSLLSNNTKNCNKQQLSVILCWLTQEPLLFKDMMKKPSASPTKT